MADTDNEILQDFLIEAKELLDGLNEQLVVLEQSPNDKNLLNSIFRSFHTIKGGAGFLELTAMVELCHEAEDVFNLLRNGERVVDAGMMDVILQALDALNEMFGNLQGGAALRAAAPELLDGLRGIIRGEVAHAASTFQPVIEAPRPAVPPSPPPVAAPAPAPSVAPGAASGVFSEDQFQAMLSQLGGIAQQSAAPAARPAPVPVPETPAQMPVEPTSGSGLITEDEFEQLLNQLHGQGGAPGAHAPVAAPPSPPAAPPPAAPPPPPPAAAAPPPAQSGALAVMAPTAVAAPPAVANDADALADQMMAQMKADKADTTVRVDTTRLDAIMNLVGELVLVRNRLNTLKASFGNEDIAKVISNLDAVTSDLQTEVMKTRMQPIKKVFGRFPRVVRDLARSLGKEINLVLRGEDTDLDKNLVDALGDPLIHLVRNGIDHGIEMPDLRQAAGKPRMGTVELAAEQEGDHILLIIRDDGAGMNPDKLRRKAVEKGLLDSDAAARLSDQEAFELILLPGFSTKDQISDISGRGVGMDVVKSAITRLSGTIEIQSQLGRGTLFRIKVPLTLAILPTLMVVVRGRKYAMPLGNINEIFEMADKKTNNIDGQSHVIIRSKALPVYDLRSWLAMPYDGGSLESREGQVVLVQVGTVTAGLIVDQVIGQEEVVIKPLGELLHGVPGIAGATITGDGNIALILDLPSLLRHYGRRRELMAD